MFDISVVQGWILYKRGAGNYPLSLKTFKVSVAMSLMKEGKSARTSRGRPSTSVERAFIAKRKSRPAAPIPNISIRTDCYDHLLSFTEKKGQCRKSDCKGFTFVECSKCNVRLCLTKAFNCL